MTETAELSRRQQVTGDPDRVFDKLTEYPPDFTVHPKLSRQFDARVKMWEDGEVDWATAEARRILESHEPRTLDTKLSAELDGIIGVVEH